MPICFGCYKKHRSNYVYCASCRDFMIAENMIPVKDIKKKLGDMEDDPIFHVPSKKPLCQDCGNDIVLTVSKARGICIDCFDRYKDMPNSAHIILDYQDGSTLEVTARPLKPAMKEDSLYRNKRFLLTGQGVIIGQDPDTGYWGCSCEEFQVSKTATGKRYSCMHIRHLNLDCDHSPQNTKVSVRVPVTPNLVRKKADLSKEAWESRDPAYQENAKAINNPPTPERIPTFTHVYKASEIMINSIVGKIANLEAPVQKEPEVEKPQIPKLGGKRTFAKKDEDI